MGTKLNITEGISPMPALMIGTYSEDGSVNVMNTALGTMQGRDIVALNLTETHKTVQSIKAQGAFTVSIADAAHMVEADHFGVEYGCGVIGKMVNVTADERIMMNGRIDMARVQAIAFDPYTHGYYKVTERVGEAFKDGLKLKKQIFT